MPRHSRVLHVLKYYRPTFTGEGVFLERCSGVMQALAPSVEHDLLVTRTPRPSPVPAACSTIADVFYLTTRPMSTWGHEFALFWWCIRNFWRYQTIHIRTHADWYLVTYVLAKLLRRRLVISATLDDSIPVLVEQYRPRWRPLVHWVFRLFDAYVAISPKLHEENIRAVERSRCHLLPCGIDLPKPDGEAGKEVRHCLGIPEDAFVLIFVGGLCARKDPLMLVQQLPAILRQRPDTFLLLVGPPLEPEHVAGIQKEIREHNIEAHVLFTGEVRDPHPYFDAADVMAFGSHLEGLGTVVLEAMAHALPVVVRHLPGVNDMFVEHGQTGFLFQDNTGYLGAVSRLVQQPTLRQEIGARARERVVSSFSMAESARGYLHLYGFPPQEYEDNDMLPAGSSTATAIRNSASIVSPRFRQAVETSRLQCPRLLTLIDAEEAFDWSAPFCRSQTDVCSMQSQGLAHRIFERFAVVPTYMVDYPVATQDAGRAPLQELLQQGYCDIGSQLHAWVTPPFVEAVTNRNSYPGNLSPALELEKIRRLTESIESAFGVRPRIYRAGRYGAGVRTGDILKHLGYLADSSVMAKWDFSDHQGPDYTHISSEPYWIDEDRQVLEIPASAAVVGKLSPLPHALERLVFGTTGNRIGIPGLTARLGLLERIKLTPEGIAIHEAKRLVQCLMAQGQKVFVLTYHTPSLVPGNTPYVRTSSDLERFLRWLEEFYAFFQDEIGGVFSTWREMRDLVSQPEELLGVPAEGIRPA
ncbi:MAG TPA: glycosyltransferase [Acidobacteriaceae bacterium]|jgi:glycosyltransferase involved in cell wall biosynthesis|nr:glycosyltransferase [Acidobacteriaceae bacterium]